MGGIRLVNKICTRCKVNYLGIHNQLLCDGCKSVGFDRVCKACNISFITKYRYTNHCDECKKTKIWKLGKFPNRGKAISDSKKAFFQTEYGKEVAKVVGKINSGKMKQFLQSDKGKESLISRSKKISETMKKKIFEGIFTPKITNTFTHWNAIIDTGAELRKFRSSWEACIWYCNQHWEYETVRIKYVGLDLQEHNYIVDFYDPTTSTLYEVKPKCHINESSPKIEAAKIFCKNNNMNFILISENNLLNYINPNIFFGNNKKQLEKCLK